MFCSCFVGGGKGKPGALGSVGPVGPVWPVGLWGPVCPAGLVGPVDSVGPLGFVLMDFWWGRRARHRNLLHVFMLHDFSIGGSHGFCRYGEKAVLLGIGLKILEDNLCLLLGLWRGQVWG